MRPNVVVVLPPGLDRCDRLWAASEVLDAQALVAELPVEALVGAVLPRFAGIAERAADALGDDPLQDRVRHELRPVVRAHEGGRAVDAHETGEHVDDAARADAAGDVDGEALARPLVDDGEALELLAIGAGVEDEVVRPDVIPAGRRRRARSV